MNRTIAFGPILIAIAASVLVGCAQPERRIELVSPESPETHASSTPVSDPEDRESKAEPPLSTPNPTMEEPLSTMLPKAADRDPIPPDLLNSIVLDLATRLSIDTGQVQVLSIQSVLWKDSSLGCPEKGLIYLQVLTPGYRVLLEAKGRQFDYRTDESGRFLICP